jgi:1,2-diacylglycerol 3-beta-galactosyltransferase
LRQYGLPIRPAFAEAARPKETLRQELRMAPLLPAALLVGGGEGLGPLASIACAIADRLWVDGVAAGQLVVICGRNHGLQRRLAAHPWPIPVQIHGFVHNMSDWMAACDCIVTKAGPGAIAEALIRGLPIILSGYIPGQEDGNIPFVVENEVGIYSEDPVVIAETIYQWFGVEQEELKRMARHARRLGNPRSTYQIVEELARLLGAYQD